jgi:hypothetical protein
MVVGGAKKKKRKKKSNGWKGGERKTQGLYTLCKKAN